MNYSMIFVILCVSYITYIISKKYKNHLNFLKIYTITHYNSFFGNKECTCKNKKAGKITIVNNTVHVVVLGENDKEYDLILPYDRVLAMNMKDKHLKLFSSNGMKERTVIKHLPLPGVHLHFKPGDLGYEYAIFEDNFGDEFKTDKNEKIKMSK